MRFHPRATAVAVASLLAVTGAAAIPALATNEAQLASAYLATIPLSSGTPIPVAGTVATWTYYTIEVPQGATQLTVKLSGGTGDADLYVRGGAQPTSYAYDCRPFLTGNNETCTVNVTPGTYYIGIYGYATYSGATLVATHNGSTTPTSTSTSSTSTSTSTSSTSTSTSTSSTSTATGNVLTNGVPVTTQGAAGDTVYYSFTVPAGATNLKVTTSGGNGDADLYVRAGARPTASLYDCRPYETGNEESCSFASPAAGTYWVGVDGYEAFSGVALTASWTEPAGTTSTTSTSTSTSTTSTTSTTPAPGSTLPAGPWGDDLSLARSVSNEDSKYPAMSNPEIDTLRYHLDLDYNGSTLNGKATVVFRAAQSASTVRLDLHNTFSVSSVTLDGTPISFSRDTHGLRMSTGYLTVDSQHTLVISYAGVPQNVPMPSSRTDVGNLGWTKDSYSGDISTNQEPYGAFTWYPVNDTVWDKAYYTATIKAPTGKVGVFNGLRTQTATASDGRNVSTFVLDKPCEAYLTTIAIGNYALQTKTMTDGTPYQIWYEPQDASRLPAMWSAVSTAWSWLDSHMAAYPFASAGMVVVGKGSAMETQTLITMNRAYIDDVDVVLHETAHQWNGDSVSPWDWRDLWLNEGWAMFWELDHNGSMSDYSVAQACRSSVLGSGGPAGDYNAQAFGENNVYMCGARAIRAIRSAVGTTRFAQMATSWQDAKKYGNATRADFIAHVKSTTGFDPTSILNNWLGSNPQ